MAPTYEYRCRACASEHLDQSAELAGTPCSEASCDGTLKRVWSVGVVWPADERGHG
jgi:predicted nucleic acid-binding Zn ribbon protein